MSSFADELTRENLVLRLQDPQQVQNQGIQLDCGYRIDSRVAGVLILELKSVDKLIAIHEAQWLTRMNFADAKTGLQANFNVTKLKDGIKRFLLCTSRGSLFPQADRWLVRGGLSTCSASAAYLAASPASQVTRISNVWPWPRSFMSAAQNDGSPLDLPLMMIVHRQNE